MVDMDDNAFVRVISRLGLDYSQAITATRLLSKETQVLDNQLRQVRMTAAQMAQMPGMNNMAGFSTASQMAQNKVIVDQYGRSLSVISDNTAALTRNTAKATVAAKQHTQTVKAMAQQYNILGSQLERRMSWFVTGTALFGGMQAGAEMVRTMKDVQFGMTEIARVTEDANFNFANMRDELQSLGIEYGKTWDTVHDISLRWAQAGYNVADTLELTRTSMLALNTAELDANYATSGLVAIMAQWGLTADQLMPKIDKLNKVADDYALTTQDLVDGLNRSSGAARAMGMTFEDTVAILTVMREASGRTGKEVGNALNSIIAFMQRPKSLEVFSELGINVFADQARTKFRPVIDILNDISKSYATASDATKDMFVDAAKDAGLYTEEVAEAAGATEEWTDVQKRDVSQAAAGIYRRSYLLALLNNFTKVYDVLQTQSEALGYSERENARTMQTLEMQWNSLKAAAEQLAVAIGEAGLLEQISALVRGTTKAIEWFNGLDETTKKLIITFIEINALLRITRGLISMTGIGSFAGLAGGLLSGWAMPIGVGAAGKNMTMLATSATAASTALTNLGRGILTALGGPQIAIITGAAVAIGLLAKKLYDLTEAQENDPIKNTESYIKSLEDEKNAAEKAIAKQRELVEQLNEVTEARKAGNLSAEEELALAAKENKLKNEQLKNSQEIKKAIGDEAYVRLEKAKFNEETQNKEIEALKQRLESQRKYLHEMKILHAKETLSHAEQTRKRIENMTKEIEALQKKIKAYDVEAGAWREQQTEHLVPLGGTGMNRVWDASLNGGKGGYRAATVTEAVRLDPNFYGGLAAQDELRQISEEKKKAEEENEKILAELDKVIADIGSIATGVGGGGGPGFGGGGGGQQKALNDLIDDYIKKTEYLANAQARLNDKTQRSINLKQAAIDFYRREGATAAETAKAYQLEAELIDELKQKQQGIHVEADALRAAKEMLAQRMSSLNRNTEEGADAFEKLADEIEQLSDRENQLSTEWWTLEGQIKSLNPLLKQMEQNYQNVSDAIGHWGRMGVLSARQQIDALRELSTIKALSAAEQWALDEQIHGHYMDLISEEYDELERLYSDRIEQIEKDAETAIGAIQDQIDALNNTQEQDNRAEAERKHKEKLKELEEQYRYHDLRTGAEHEKAKADIAKQIEEEKLAWERQQNEWATEDRKDELEQQIEDVKQAAEEEKSEWQKAWNEIQNAFSDHNRRIISAAASAADEWYQKWKSKVDQLKEDIESGTPSGATGGAGSVGGVVDDAEDSLPVGGGGSNGGGLSPKVSYKIYPGQYDIDNNIAYMKSRDLAAYLDKDVDWDPDKREVIIGNRRYKPWKHENNITWLPVRKVAEDFGWDVGWDVGSRIIELSKAHTGAKTLSYGIAELMPGELIFPPTLSVKLERLISVLNGTPTQQISTSTTIDRGRSTTLNGPLFNAEKVVFEDRTDMEIMGRELKRAIDAV